MCGVMNQKTSVLTNSRKDVGGYIYLQVIFVARVGARIPGKGSRSPTRVVRHACKLSDFLIFFSVR